jgi:hypothetical protein
VSEPDPLALIADAARRHNESAEQMLADLRRLRLLCDVVRDATPTGQTPMVSLDPVEWAIRAMEGRR